MESITDETLEMKRKGEEHTLISSSHSTIQYHNGTLKRDIESLLIVHREETSLSYK